MVTGPAVRALEASFYENWLESGGGRCRALDPSGHRGGDQRRSIVVWSNPTGGASNVKLLFCSRSPAPAHDRHPSRRTSSSTNPRRWALDAARNSAASAFAF